MTNNIGPSPTPAVTDVRFVPAFPDERRTGLIGFVSFTFGGLRIHGATIRRSLEGRIYVGLPTRTDARGRRHPLVESTDRRARAELESAILAALPPEALR